MKIALVHDFLTKLGGAEKVLQVMHEIYPDAPVFTLLYSKEGTKNEFEGRDYQIVVSSLAKYPSFLIKKPKLFLSKLPNAIEEFNFNDFDVVISLSNSFAHGVITKPKTLHLTYSYSPMRYAWDWYHEYLDENSFDRGLKGYYAKYLLHNIRIWDRVAAFRTDYWIAQSQTAQQRLRKYYRVDSKIIYPPADIEAIQYNGDPPDNSYLIISRLEPYKKIEIALEAFSKNKEKLYIIGQGSDQKRLQRLASHNVEFLGWQPEDKVVSYLQKTKALILPGEEDFGLTPIESMAAGRPVIAYGQGGVTETVIGGKTGLFFNEPTPDSLNKTIQKLNDHYSDFSATDCCKRAESFSRSHFMVSIKQEVEDQFKHYQSAFKTK